MRKDLKLGLAVGGVFLFVVVAYLVVHSNTRSAPGDEPPVVVGPESPAVTTGEEIARPGGDVEKPGVADAGREGKGGDAGVIGGQPQAPDAPKREGDMWADTGNKEQVAKGDAAKGRDWSAILAPGGQVPPPLLTETPGLKEKVAPHPGNEAAGGHDAKVIGTEPGRATDVKPAGNDASPGAARGARTHVMQRGETFSSIAKQEYGDAKYFAVIVKANPTLDPAKVRPNTVINVPELSQAKPEQKAAVEPAIDPRTEYKVQAGDSLYRISMKLYQRPEKAEAIYEMNKETIGADSAKLKLGAVLKLPEPPTATASR